MFFAMCCIIEKSLKLEADLLLGRTCLVLQISTYASPGEAEAHHVRVAGRQDTHTGSEGFT